MERAQVYEGLPPEQQAEIAAMAPDRQTVALQHFAARCQQQQQQEQQQGTAAWSDAAGLQSAAEGLLNCHADGKAA